LSPWLRDIASLGTEVVVRFCNVQDETGKAHLLRRRFVTEFVRRHLLHGSDQLFFLVGKDLLHYARDRIFVLLRKANRSRSKECKGKSVMIGGPRLLTEGKVTTPPEVERLTTAWASEGKTVLFAIAEGQLLGAFALEDEIRPESKEAVSELHRLGIQVAMITGDSKKVADSVAQRIGIDEVAAEVLPADKASAVARFQASGKRVAMVGDGVNDAPALATADVGIAIGAGTDVAIESAGIVLVRSDPRDVVGAIELSRATYRKMVQNLVWATAYNLVAIPVAGGLLVRWGVDFPMSVGAVAMNLSTIIVAANAQLLRGLKLQRMAT